MYGSIQFKKIDYAGDEDVCIYDFVVLRWTFCLRGNILVAQ